MNKKPTKRMVIGSLVIMALILLAIQIKISEINYEKRHRDNDSYVDYVYKDPHLVCVKEGERAGMQIIEKDGPDYRYYYNLIKDVSDDEFIAAYEQPIVFFPNGRDIILQSPDSDTNVLKDWKIKEIDVFYFEYKEVDMFRQESATRRGDYIVHSIARTSESAIIEELLDTLLNSTPDMGFDMSEERENYKKVKMPSIDFYLRLHFEETKGLVWDASIEIYRNNTDNSKYEITLYYNTYGDETERESYEVQLDSSSELYQMIWEAYQENLVEFVEEV